MSAQHTPGPWKAERAKRPDNTGGYDFAITDQDNQIIAEAFEHTGYAGGTEHQYIIQPVAANGRLIAAAPDLLDGCNALDGLLTLLLARDDLPPAVREVIETSHRREEARAAIAKAGAA